MQESLDRLQRRFFAAVTPRAVAKDLAPRAAHEWIHARTEEEATRRLDLYQEMHRSRLHDVLRDDYLRVHAALGDDDFAELAFRYLEAHPSRSSTLHELGSAFPAFVAHTLPTLADVARLDAARNRVFDAADDAPLSPSDLASWDSDAWQQTRVRRIHASLLLPCTTNIADAWLAHDTKAPAPALVRCAQTLLIWRREFVVRHREVDRHDAGLLTLLAEPSSMAAVCEALTDRCETSPEQTFQRLHQWLIDGLLALA